MDENSENNKTSIDLPKGSAIQVSIENDDGSLSKVMEVQPQYSFEQYEVSDLKESVTLPLQYHIETYCPANLTLIAPITLSREFVGRLAESLGLLDSE